MRFETGSVLQLGSAMEPVQTEVPAIAWQLSRQRERDDGEVLVDQGWQLSRHYLHESTVQKAVSTVGAMGVQSPFDRL